MNKKDFLDAIFKNENRENYIFFLNQLNKEEFKDIEYFKLNNSEIIEVLNSESGNAYLLKRMYFKDEVCTLDKRNNKLIDDIDYFLFKNEFKTEFFKKRKELSSLDFISSYCIDGFKESNFDDYCERTCLTIDDFLLNLKHLDKNIVCKFLFSYMNRRTSSSLLIKENFKEVFLKINCSEEFKFTDSFNDNVISFIKYNNEDYKEEMIKFICDSMLEKSKYCELLIAKIKSSHKDLCNDLMDEKNLFSLYKNDKEKVLERYESAFKEKMRLLEKIYINCKLDEKAVPDIKNLKRL